LPWNANGSPVSHARMMRAPNSSLGVGGTSLLERGGAVGRFEPLAQRVPFGDLALAPARVLVERDAEALDELGPRRLDEPRHVLGEVLGGLGHEGAEVAHRLVADAVPLRDAILGDDPAQFGVEVAALVGQRQEERQVVDARHVVAQL
jgi:hypothetical protein